MTSEKSGSMPVVSQSIMKPMVPVGARTEAWLLRHPFFWPISRLSFHCLAASRCTAMSIECSVRISSLAAWCLRMTRSCAEAFWAKPS